MTIRVNPNSLFGGAFSLLREIIGGGLYECAVGLLNVVSPFIGVFVAF
jgi:hypothetical protein